MSIKACLNSAVSQKQISKEAAEELDLLYNRFVAQHAIVHGDAEARRLALEQVAKRLEASAAQRRRKALLTAAGLERLDKAVFGYKNVRGEIAPDRALPEIMETFGKRDEGMSIGSVQGRAKAIHGQALAELEELLVTFDRKLVGGRRNKALLDNVVYERAGEGTGDVAAKQFADALEAVLERLRQRFNAAGGAIRKLEKYIGPQIHNAQALRNVGFGEWIDGVPQSGWSKYIYDRLDWDRMRHALSGDPILPDERQEVLQHVFNTATTDGWFDRLPSSQPQGRGALYKQHSDHRFLLFKDADSYLSYQRDFGEGDYFAAVMAHIKVMARDIAAMEILTPDPPAAIAWITNKVMQEAHKAAAGMPARFGRGARVLGRELYDPVSRAGRAVHLMEAMWEHYSGAADVAVDKTTAAVMTTARNMTSAGSLGSAVLSAVGDPGFGALARSFAMGTSVPGGLMEQFSSTVKSFGQLSQREAIRAGIIFEHAASTFGEKAREANAISGPIISRKIADTTMRVQGLSAWTQVQKNALGLDMMGKVADLMDKGWVEMTPEVQRLFRRYGFREGDWDIIRLAQRHDLSPDGQGATILRPREIARLTAADLKRLMQADTEATLAARRVIRLFDDQLVRVGDNVRQGLDDLVRVAEQHKWTTDQILTGFRNLFSDGSIIGPNPRGLPKKLRDQLYNTVWTRTGLLRTLAEIRDGTYAVSEIARTQWRDSPEFQALPQWFRDLVSDPLMTVGDVRDTLRAMVDPPERALDEFPSIPSDSTQEKLGRAFQNLADRYLEMIQAESVYGVIEPTLQSKAIWIGKLRPGTLQGEGWRAFSQFKSFGTVVVLLHMGRMWHELQAGRIGKGSALKAIAALFMFGGLGMAALQSKQVAKGEDLRDMRDWRVWFGAMQQAGGFGIYGDFLLADQNRFGGGFIQTLAGPLPSRVADVLRATLGNVQQGADGKKTNAQRELLRLGNSWNPVASLWLTKLAWDRLAYRQLQRVIDPEASQAMAREIRAARRNRGTDFWWQIGETRPDRLPGMGTSAGR